MLDARAALLVSVLSMAACDRTPAPAPEPSSAPTVAAVASAAPRVEPWLPVDAAFKGCAGG